MKFQLGESSLVSTTFREGHDSAGLLTLIISVWEGRLYKSSMQCSSDYLLLSQEKGKKTLESRVKMGKGSLYLSVNFVQISPAGWNCLLPVVVLGHPTFCVKQTFVHPYE